MNEEILVDLTNPGLVRRAKKALEKSSPILDEQQGFEFEEQTGHLDLSNPKLSQCNCNALGLCKHIIAAYLFAQQSTHDTDSQNAAENDVSSVKIDLNALFSELSKPRLRKLYQQLLAPPPYQVTQQAGMISVVIKRATIRFQKAHTLDDLVCLDQDLNLAPLAVLLYCQQENLSIPWPEDLVTEQNLVYEQSQAQQHLLIEQCRAHLLTMVNQGIDVLRAESLLELTALLIPMKAQGLPTHYIKQLLGRLEDYIAARGIRDRGQIISLMAKALASLESTASVRQELPDEAPTQLHCLAGYPWQTASGAHGITLLFQDEHQRFITLSESRAERTSELNYDQLWRHVSMLNNAPAGHHWLGKKAALYQGELNAWHRLRRLESTSVALRAKQAFTAPSALTNITDIDWGAAYLCFQPDINIEQYFDESSQSMQLSYLDDAGNRLQFEMPYSKLNQAAVNNLENLGQATPDYIVARIERTITKIRLIPLSICLHQQWINLYFDTLPTPQDKALFQPWLERIADAAPPVAKLTRIQGLLQECVKQLADQPPHHAPDLIDQCYQLGLTTLAHYLNVADARSWLQAAYCTQQLLDATLVKPSAGANSHEK